MISPTWSPNSAKTSEEALPAPAWHSKVDV